MKYVVACLVLLASVGLSSTPAFGATLQVCASGCPYSDLQVAIDAAVAGDTILLRAGETFAGPFVLRAKPASTQWITIRSDAADSSLPAAGVRLIPSGKPGANTSRSLLPRLIGRGNTYRTTPVIQTEPGAHHYRLQFLEIDGSESLGWETLLALGDDTAAATAYDIVLDRVYAHGHFQKGQKRGIALNSGRTEILNSYVSDIRAVGFDSQAIGGWNGAGPYKIINNYLEAAGENIMFGGSDPAVYNLVPSNIEIRRNHISKPTTWAGAILAAPASPRAVDAGTGGSLAAGTHYFRVVALLDTGPVTANSTGSAEVSVYVPGSRSATISWAAVPGAERYRIYRGTAPGGQSRYLETSGAVTSFQYSGTSEAWGTVPGSASEWVIKNLIEFKNAQQVLVDGNIIENVWAAGQVGYAVVITPRNQYGTAPWVRVQDVTFSNNIIRNAVAVLTLAGYDDLAPSQQTQRITFRNNLIYGIDSTGGWAKTFTIGLSPAYLVFDRNTIIQQNTSVLFAYGSQIPGVVFTNNVTLHNQYGIMGNGGQPGTYSINMYFPGGIVTNNVLAGGVASAYPVPNSFPTVQEFWASFVDPANADYRLRSSSPFYTAGAGGTPPGIDPVQLQAALGSGASPTSPPAGGNAAPVANPSGPYAGTAGVPLSFDASRSSDPDNNLAAYTWRFHDDVVVHASQVAAADIVGSLWVRGSAAGAADGIALVNADRGSPKVDTAFTNPASYVDVRFQAAAGVPYRLWFRMRAQSDFYGNDSMFVQFSGAVDAQGRAVDRIGTASALRVSLEEGTGAGLSGWGWNDHHYGGLASPVYFAASGPQVLRIQQREDGLMWDQIVISADTYGAAAPGPPRNDNTLLPHGFGTSTSAVSTHTFALPGTYPIELRVTDSGGLSAIANTTAVIAAPGTSALTARAGGPYTGAVNGAVTFDGSGSTASAGATYHWSFGDDIVLTASDFRVSGSRWRVVSDGSAAGGLALENPDWNEPKRDTAYLTPAHNVEATFRAAAGVPYRVWVRMRAAGDSWSNDSVFVQFSGSVTSTGAATHRIGTASAMTAFLEDGSGAGLAGWGWADNVYGGTATPIYFNSDADQRILIQQREDGVRIDQVVISAGTYAYAAPGAVKNDTTIVPRFPSAVSGAVVSHVYRFAGNFPVTLFVTDGSASSSASTTATIR